MLKSERFALLITMDVDQYFQKSSTSVEWLALIEPGFPIKDDDNWICSRKDKFPLFDGYKAARIVKNKEGKIFKVICGIEKSTLGLPIFSCSAYEFDKELNNFKCDRAYFLSLRKISSVSNAILQKMDVPSNKVWSGSQFFG